MNVQVFFLADSSALNEMRNILESELQSWEFLLVFADKFSISRRHCRPKLNRCNYAEKVSVVDGCV